jgi:hypothetical protein
MHWIGSPDIWEGVERARCVDSNAVSPELDWFAMAP